MNHKSTLYDLIIIGGGPAGVAGGVYAARKRLKTLFITKDFQGQSAVSEGIENWIGNIKISGTELAKNLENHLKSYTGEILTVKEGELCESVTKTTEGFKVKTNEAEYDTKTILVCTGSYRQKLTVPGADIFEHKGLTYCATCDGPLFADQDVVVVGGGNAAFESASQLLAYCKSVTLVNRSAVFRADPITVERVLANPKMRAIMDAVPAEVKGSKFVNTFVYTDKKTGKNVEIPTTGIFVEIGLLPNTSFIKDITKLDKWNHIIVDPRNQRAQLVPPPETTPDARRGESGAGDVVGATATATQRLHNNADGGVSGGGIWAAGDCTDGLFHQNNIAAGDAVKAIEDIYNFLHTK
ncbi:FAD-binding protein [Patescibacteria group bacterium]|nr:MAG: FAD-binding protein [Patescibacteria group bacterium]